MTLAEHHITHIISRDPSIKNFREDAGIEYKSIQASSYHHSTVPQIQDPVTSLRPGFLIAKICDASNAQPM